MNGKKQTLRVVAALLMMLMLENSFHNSVLLALTGGNTQVNFAGFDPAGSSEMVNEFTGDFSYSIPLLTVPGPGGGFSMALNYNSGVTMEDEASWVGYGWSFTPGAISRQKQGLPDDYYGAENTITQVSKMPPVVDVQFRKEVSVEAFSFDIGKYLKDNNLSVGLSQTNVWNNYTGFTRRVGFTSNFALGDGLAAVDYERIGGNNYFSAQVSPLAILAKGMEIWADKKDKDKLWRATRSPQVARLKQPGSFEFSSLNMVHRPFVLTPYIGGVTSFKVGLMPQTPLPVGLNVSLQASVLVRELKDVQTLGAYGYLYSHKATSSGVMDYSVFNEDTYNKRDRYLPMPIGTADIFQVSGIEGQGSFRCYNKLPGFFRPNSITSYDAFMSQGIEQNVAGGFGGGTNVGRRYHQTSVGAWGATGHAFADYQDGDEPYYFRYLGDVSGRVDQTHLPTTQAYNFVQAVLSTSDITSSPTLLDVPFEENRNSRSAMIAHRLNRELAESPISFDQSYVGSKDIIGRSDSKISNGIGELSIKQNSGNTFNYGLPVYTRNEGNYWYGLRGLKTSDYDLEPASGLAHGLGTSTILRADIGKSNMIMGQTLTDPYASSFLLTSIYSPDYVDRTYNGPSDDDLGGYVKFNYEQLFGSDFSQGRTKSDPQAKWYRWRAPYYGLNFEQGELSDPTDDGGSVAFGEKEVYVLKDIETKTHYAEFVTKDRLDCLPALANTIAAKHSNSFPGANGYSQVSANSELAQTRMQMLDEVRLYKKGKDGAQKGELLQVIHFEYDYELCPGVPNAVAQGGNPVGKLTLRRVWVDNRNIQLPEVSHYEFDYSYPDGTQIYPAPYKTMDLASHGNGLVNQNPTYNLHNTDRWGKYRENGKQLIDAKNEWVDPVPSASFDPAAWHLKQIKLPTGAEIHVQYEQDSYTYVQGDRAESMYVLADYDDQNMSIEIDFSDWLDYVDPLNMNRSNLLNTQFQRILSQYVDPGTSGDKMYFNFNYKLTGNTISTGDCDMEKIDGFVSINDAEIVTGTDRIRLYFDSSPDGPNPKRVCKDFYRTQRKGRKLEMCDPSYNSYNLNVKAGSLVNQLANQSSEFASPLPLNVCSVLDETTSYVRLPSLGEKKGGGVRVKRLLMFDKGVTASPADDVLYGTEYNYNTSSEEGALSSGVATNEPVSGREENALVKFLPRDKQKFASRVVTGRDRKQYEGPLGEGLLPGASVGYARVESKSINPYWTNSGVKEVEFYTAKDFPFICEVPGEIERERNFDPWLFGLYNDLTDQVVTAQGYRVKRNNFHGKPKSSTVRNAQGAVAAKTQYNYFPLGTAVPVFEQYPTTSELDGPPANYPKRLIGQQIELVHEGRYFSEEGLSIQGEVDMGLGLAGIIPIPYFTGLPSFKKTLNENYRLTTTKVIDDYAMLESVETTVDGVSKKVVNEAFDPVTGAAVVKQTFDDYHEFAEEGTHNGNVKTVQRLAHNHYPAAKPAYQTQDILLSQVMPNPSMHPILVHELGEQPYLTFDPNQGVDLCDIADLLTKGDLLYITESYNASSNTLSSALGYAYYDRIEGSNIYLEQTSKPDLQLAVRQYDVNAKVQCKIVRTARNNITSLPMANEVFYGVEGLPQLYQADVQSSEEVQELEDFAEELNHLISTGEKINEDDIPSSVKFFDGTPILGDVTWTSGVEQGDITFGAGMEKYSPKSAVNHQAVTDVNNFLHELWGLEIDVDAHPNLVSSDPQTIVWPDGTSTQVHGLIGLPVEANDLYNSYKDIEYADVLLNSVGYPNQPVVRKAKFSDFISILGDLFYAHKEETSDSWRLYSSWISYSADYVGNAKWKQLYVSNGKYVYYLDQKSTHLPYYSIQNFIEVEGFENLLDIQGDVHGRFNFAKDNLLLDYYGYYLRAVDIEDLSCTESLFDVAPGSFEYDQTTNRIVYFQNSNSCDPVPLTCISIDLDPELTTGKLNHLLSTSGQTYKDEWLFDGAEINPFGHNYNKFESGYAGKLFPNQSFGYIDELTAWDHELNADDRVYNGGWMDDVAIFDPFGSLSANWVNTSTITAVDQNGQVVEQTNALDIPSCSKVGYDNTLVYASAANCRYDQLYFEGFEYSENTGVNETFQEGIVLGNNSKSEIAHSGSSSIEISDPIRLKTEVIGQVEVDNYKLLIWARSESPVVDLAHELMLSLFQESNPINKLNFSAHEIARAGEWTLLEILFNISGNEGVPGQNLAFELQRNPDGDLAEVIQIDDIRISPTDAQVMCYVYDPVDHLPLVSFGDQHFGVFNRYNAKGQLVRKSIETERGLMMISEGQYNLPDTDRNLIIIEEPE